MRIFFFRILLLTGFCFSAVAVGAQTSAEYSGPAKESSLTIVYDINIIKGKTKAGIEETYNGGVKTLMLKNETIRMRLVSLMRIQSIYLYKTDSVLKKVIIAKESGQKKYKYILKPSEWKFYNEKYDSVSCILTDDSLLVAGYECKKAILTFRSGKEVIAFYTIKLKPFDKYTEPMFAGLPGMVLRYEHEEKNGRILFNASKVSFDPIDGKIFEEPGPEFHSQKYHPIRHE